jgi:hypothetical protein
MQKVASLQAAGMAILSLLGVDLDAEVPVVATWL